MSPLQLTVEAWQAVDDRGNKSLHRDHTAANNYVTKPHVHGVVRALVALDDVEELFDATFRNEGET